MRDPARSRRDIVIGGVHLAVLSALALAQPVLDILGKNPAFFAVRGSTGTQIVLFAVAITLGLPALLLLVELLVPTRSRRGSRTRSTWCSSRHWRACSRCSS